MSSLAANKRKLRWYYRQIQLGNCTTCGMENDTPQVRKCSVCRLKIKIRRSKCNA